MIRSIVWGVSCVCKVEKTRCPVSGGGERRGDGLGVAHLTDEDHIRVLRSTWRSASGETTLCRNQPRAG